jgi:asparagine synthase (glutamine-hydrolysing)
MWGIGGIAWTAASEGLVEPLAAMEASMVRRGPDDGGIELLDLPGGGAVGLCARRLAIQDLSPRGHQPLSSAQSGSWVCLNGEIYNADELRPELAGRGQRFRGSSDADVVLAAYEAWGERCFSRLRGMFAVAIWDAPGRRLVLARDRLGIKPLYYHLAAESSTFLFGSEIRALMASGLVAPSVSLPGVASYLATGAVEEPGTILTDVLSLPPGHIGIWEGNRLRLTAYWSLAERFAVTSNLARADAVAAIRGCLEDTFRRHLVSDVPLGVFLSGGVDSSALVGLVAAIDQPPQTVSVVFPQQQWSKERYIRLIAERFDTRHTQIVLDDSQVLAKVPAALAAMDQPTFDGVNTFIVSGQARAAGLTVALSGVGGDELFAGYDTFRIVPRLEQLRTLVRGPLRPLAAGIALAAARDSDRGRKLARWLVGRNPELSAVTLRRELFGPDAVAGLLGNAAPLAPPAPLAALPTDVANRISLIELDRYMRNVLLRDSGVLSMAHGLEVRVPFLDHDVVELVAGLPGPLKTAAGSVSKSLLVDAIADLLPPEVVRRPKRGFALPFPVWLRGALRAQVEAALLDPGFGGGIAAELDHSAVADGLAPVPEREGGVGAPLVAVRPQDLG